MAAGASRGGAAGHLNVVGAVLAVVAGLSCMMLAWRALLTDLGSPLALPAATRVMFLGQLAKYVPGALWAVAAQVSLAQDYQVPKRRSGTASLVSMAITLVVGLVMAAVTLPLAYAGALRQYWWVLLCIPVVLAGLYPPITKFGLDILFRIIRQPALEKPLSLNGMARAVGWTALGWVFYGLHAFLLVGDIAGGSLHILLLSAGGYALAWAVGFLLIPFPGGIGPREIALIAVLSPVMARGPGAGHRAGVPCGHDNPGSGVRRAGRCAQPPCRTGARAVRSRPGGVPRERDGKRNQDGRAAPRGLEPVGKGVSDPEVGLIVSM